MNIVAIAICVPSPPGLPPLNGLSEASKEFMLWVDYLKTTKDYITGSDNTVVAYQISKAGEEPVSADQIRSIVPWEIFRGANWVIVYFCGHGYFVNGSQVWVLDGTERDPESFISVAGLQSAIASHGVQEISIISDACQVLALDKTSTSRIFRRGLKEDDVANVDLLYAAVPGQAANISYDKLTNAWQPIFSTALFDLLLETPAPASNVVLPPGEVINSQTLKSYLMSEVPSRASAAGIQLGQKAKVESGRVPPQNTYRLIKAFALPEDQVGTTKAHWTTDAAPDFSDIFKGPNELGEPPPTPTPPPFGPPPLFVEKNLSLKPSDRLEALEEIFLDDTRGGPPSLWFSRSDGLEISLAGRLDPFLQPTPFGRSVELRMEVDGDKVLAASIPFFPNLSCLVSVSARIDEGIELVTWKSEYPANGPEGRLLGAEILARWLKDDLSVDQAHLVAAEFRRSKHENPLLGILACYLYDKINDVDSIRRTAAFYYEVGQPIPIDVALMCRAPLLRTEDGFSVSFDAVSESPPPFADAPRFIWDAHRPVEGAAIAGRVPLMRAGWRLLEQGRHHKLYAKIWETHSPWLTGSPFTTFRMERSFPGFLQF